MSDLTPLAAPRGPAPALTRTSALGGPLDSRKKAAIIVRFLLNEGAEVPLAQLPEELQTDLTQQMGAMRYVDRDTLAQVLAEFADEVERMGLTFPRGLAGALSALDGKISPQTAARLRKEAGVRRTGDPWEMIRSMPVEELQPILERESTEVAAVLLSKLDVSKAAELLSHLPGPDARRITYAMSLTEAVTPEAVDRIGLSLAAQIEMKPTRAFNEGPEERLGAILNVSQALTRDDVLNGLDENDEDFAQKVRKAIFTYNHIPARIQPLDVGKITREVDQAVLITALAFTMNGEDEAMKEASEYILNNLTKRMADAIREEVGEAGKIKPKDGNEAINTIIAAIRELQARGELEFVVEDEDE
ncbi:MAG: flagellar motor switch protein FliG [Rhodobacterales bacterium]|nr:MAG: flagellar motor switch protein FliG [Rhodobacterales bacterium]